MKENEYKIKQEAQERELLDKQEKLIKRKTEMLNRMRAAGTFKRILIWLRYKWTDTILLLLTLIITASILAVVSRIVWEIIKIIWSVNL